MSRFVSAVALLLLAAPATAQEAQHLKPHAFEIVTATGRHPVELEVAATPEARARGLMFRGPLGHGKGMLFDFGETRDGVAFWMRNTPEPLDMAFVAGDGTVVNVHKGAKPFDETPIPAGSPVRYVVELQSGEADLLSLAPGSALSPPAP